jgi:tetratricopeptide (TPR) repeat protein
MSRRVSRSHRLAWAVALALAFVAMRAAAEGDPRELKAREDFAAGRYQQALDVFAKLYAETLHPVYLRNIGRCYQYLGDPDRALINFREYLRKRKPITPEERAEVEGFIADMEALKKQKAAEARPPEPEKSPPPKAAIATLPSAPEPANSGATPAALVTAPAPHPTEETSSPVYTRWWFWTIVGAAAVGAGLGIAAATGAFTKTQEPGCPTSMGYSCLP